MSWVFSFFILFALSFEVNAARIRNRKVKEAPKTCTTMSEDLYLSRPSKRIYGTLKNSLVFSEKIMVIDDLGKKSCEWGYDQWFSLGDLTKYKYFINEYKNEFFPYVKTDQGYQLVKIDLETCDIAEIEQVEQLNFPDCSKKSITNRKKGKTIYKNSTKKMSLQKANSSRRKSKK